MLTKDLSITFCGVKFPNPFCLSSSPVGNCYEMCAKAYDTGWGGVVFKTIGFFIANEVSPRFDHLVKEDTGFIGFKNMEQIAEHPLEENLAALRRLKEDYPDKVLIASIMGENEQQWEELARLVQEAGADMIECNFSCPQMTSHAMGSDVGQSPELVEKYCRAVKRGSTLPMLAKMTPNIGDMCEVALAAKRGGADGIAAINTVKSITNIDLNQKIGMPIVNGKSSISGYSGKAVKPIALRFIQQMRTHPELRDFPISGIGGIETWEDAAEFLLLGAATLQVTTGIMQYGYRIVEDMASGLSHYLADQGFDSLQEMVGLANNNIVPAEDLDRSYIVYPRINLDKCVGCGRCYISCHVYAPYVDFTLNTIPDLAALAKNHNVNHFTLAFVVSKDANTCLPTWGTAYGMQNYAQYSKIKALREAGGDVMLSIGGANNAPLAASCKNVDDLMQHYYDIVDNLNLKVLDFDIEGTWVADQASIERRNLAVKKVQDKWKSEGKDIAIWYTLPILPTGLTPEGMNVLSDAKAKGVELAGVNVMTMDYGNAICQSANTEGQNIHGKCATSAIANLHSQLKGLHPNKSDAEIDAMMGTTPMVGVNDVQGEVFYLSDARLVMQDAQKRNLGMVGIWSIARDLPGGTNLSPEFHGLTKEQAPKYAFSEIFAPFTKQ